MARAFLDALDDTHEIRTLNVWSEDVPSFGPDHSAAKLAPLLGEPRTEAQERAWREVTATIRAFDAADKLVLSCPMWNYGIPHALKNYIDLIVQPLLTFAAEPKTGRHIGLLRDRPVQLLLTRSSVGEDDPADFQLPYLRHILGFIGLADVRAVVAGATTRPAEEREAYVRTQCERAREAAADF
jgi:FMN-dependent NADH-azoreductase